MNDYEKVRLIEEKPEFSALRVAEKWFAYYKKADNAGFNLYKKIDYEAYAEYKSKNNYAYSIFKKKRK